MTAYIFTGGQVVADSLSELGMQQDLLSESMIIAADSGYLTARRLGVKPQLLLGDLDSLDRSQLSEGELDEMEKCIVSPIKDDTDTQLAVDTAIERGADEIIIIGGLGGRLDHTLSSVFLLEYISDRGVKCMMTDGHNRARLMKADGCDIELCISAGYKYLSLVSLSDVCEGVSISGVYYPLDDVEITRSYSYAVSNEITSDSAHIGLRRGVMLIIESRD
ncbi:MAG: thiamine diphosphokinase [Clostridiales bacterium]|nr:thiamine diphosphokinase [Clostridiales bacterium]